MEDNLWEKLTKELDIDIQKKITKGNVKSVSHILARHTNELQELTDISSSQLEYVKVKASDIFINNKFNTANNIPQWERFSTGCHSLDLILRGGIPLNGITEIFGCSGVGKTQFCLQLALTIQLPLSLGGKDKEVVYICTEDVFPSKRFHQLADSCKTKYNLHDKDFQSGVYIQHVADFEQLRRTICIKLPRLLAIKQISLIIIDSIAGVFRSENDRISYTSRSSEITTVATTLMRLSEKFKIAVVCVNQVTDNLDNNKTEPCLGLTWSNYVTCRFGLSKYDNFIRQFEVVFAPDLPLSKCYFNISEDGISAAD